MILPQQAKATTESILRDNKWFSCRMEMILANIRDGRTVSIIDDLALAEDEAFAIADRIAGLRSELDPTETNASGEGGEE